jgi:adenylate cyclase class 2
MPAGGSNVETEIKLKVASAARGKYLLRERGRMHLKRKRTFEVNLVFDTPEGRLRAEGRLLRLRQYGDCCTLTYKGPAQPGKHKSREELETTVGSLATQQAIFERLGYRAAFRYEKYRSEYTDGVGTGVVDETPIGVYLELEGEPAWIDELAARMGFREGEYVTASYGALFQAYVIQQGLHLEHMTFEIQNFRIPNS